MPPANRNMACCLARLTAAPTLRWSAPRPSSVMAACMTLPRMSIAPLKSPLSNSWTPGTSEAPLTMPAPRAPRTSPDSVSAAVAAAPRAPCRLSRPPAPTRPSTTFQTLPRNALSAFRAVLRRSNMVSREHPTQGNARRRNAACSCWSVMVSRLGDRTSSGTAEPQRCLHKRASGVTSPRTSKSPARPLVAATMASSGEGDTSPKASYCSCKRSTDGLGVSSFAATFARSSGSSSSTASSRMPPLRQASKGTTARPMTPIEFMSNTSRFCTSICRLGSAASSSAPAAPHRGT
mmetsp:Transcript_49997/g.154693  ORF Transcript_49997/g.154693 Transcript_49997/m.154693 type:complete len:292 (-) Transcript_49997:465-1340(-)